MKYKEFEAREKKGYDQLIKIGGGYAIASKRYNQETGKILQPEIEALDLINLQVQKDELLREIASIDFITKKAKAL